MAHDLSETKILVVDNPIEVKNLRETLRDIGFNNVSEMTDGLKVITEIKKDPPQVILVNYTLPKYSGLQVFKSLQSDKQLAGIKFIMLIPKLSRAETAEIESAGVKNRLQRPFTSDDLRDMIFQFYGLGVDALKEVAKETMDRAQALFDKGEFEAALELYHEACGEFSGPECLFMQGRCCMELGMHDQAIAAFQNTQKADHRFPKLDHWLGVRISHQIGR